MFRAVEEELHADFGAAFFEVGFGADEYTFDAFAGYRAQGDRTTDAAPVPGSAQLEAVFSADDEPVHGARRDAVGDVESEGGESEIVTAQVFAVQPNVCVGVNCLEVEQNVASRGFLRQDERGGVPRRTRIVSVFEAGVPASRDLRFIPSAAVKRGCVPCLPNTCVQRVGAKTPFSAERRFRGCGCGTAAERKRYEQSFHGRLVSEQGFYGIEDDVARFEGFVQTNPVSLFVDKVYFAFLDRNGQRVAWEKGVERLPVLERSGD